MAIGRRIGDIALQSCPHVAIERIEEVDAYLYLVALAPIETLGERKVLIQIAAGSSVRQDESIPQGELGGSYKSVRVQILVRGRIIRIVVCTTYVGSDRSARGIAQGPDGSVTRDRGRCPNSHNCA